MARRQQDIYEFFGKIPMPTIYDYMTIEQLLLKNGLKLPRVIMVDESSRINDKLFFRWFFNEDETVEKLGKINSLMK